MKRGSSDLHLLIKSLSAPERGYFKKHASIHVKGSQNNYMKLFDAIDQQQEYDENALRKKLVGEPMLKNLSLAKNYLYELILSRLDSSLNDIRSQLRRDMGRIAVLEKKHLYKQAHKLIEKSITFAEKHEHYPSLFELLFVKISNRRFLSPFDKNTERELKRISQQVDSYITHYKNGMDYNSLSTVFLLKIDDIGLVRGASDIEKLKPVIENKLMRADKLALTYFSKKVFYNVLAGYHYSLQDYDKAGFYLERISVLTGAHARKDINLTVASLKNLANCQILSGKYEKAKLSIEKIKSLFSESKNLSINTSEALSIAKLELEIATQTANVPQCLSMIREVNTIIKKERKGFESIAEKETNYFNFSIAYFIARDYTSANKYLNAIINEPQYDNNNLQCVARLMSLIVSFELGKHDLIEYRVRSVYSFLLKREKLYKVEAIILTFIRKKIQKINTGKELAKACTELKMELEKALKDPNEKGFLSYFDLISWLDSKIENRPFADIVKDKAK